ncbi:MAG: efflux RND transporter periplasmic adaptor subunit [Candidatus Pristimantibacillus sp.]
MEWGRKDADHRRKAFIRVLFIIFTAGLVLLTLFGNTLQSLTLPKVRTEKLAVGSLLHTLEGIGILQPLSKEKLYNLLSWKVEKILVQKGDRVKKGQQLIIYDSGSAEAELEDQITILKKQNITMQHTQEQFIEATTGGEDQLIRNAQRDIEIGKLDLAMQERKVKELGELLQKDKTLLAPFDGVVMEMNAIAGLPSSEGDVVITNTAYGYQFSFTVDATLLSQLEISTGVQLKVEIYPVQGQQAQIINGTVFDIQDAEQRTEPLSDSEIISVPQKTIYIKLFAAELKGGEQAAIKLDKRSSNEGMIVSNEAIRQDRTGRYVYKMEEQRGALGNVFVARKVSIQTVMTTAQETMIKADSLYEEDIIIVESGEPLQDGDRVRLQ